MHQYASQHPASGIFSELYDVRSTASTCRAHRLALVSLQVRLAPTQSVILCDRRSVSIAVQHNLDLNIDRTPLLACTLNLSRRTGCLS